MTSSNHAEFMRIERHNSPSISLQLNALLNSEKPYVCALFEGGDERHFYYPEFRKRAKALNTIPDQLICNGKTTVVKVFEALQKSAPNNPRAQFFVDQDFGPFISEVLPKSENFFVTKFYSLENYLVCHEALDIIYVDLFHESVSDAVYDEYVTKYEIAYQNFIELIRPLMAWAIACRMNGYKINLNNLDYKKFKTLFSIDADLNLIPMTDYFNVFKTHTGTAGTTLSVSQLRDVEDQIRSQDPKIWIRGKYEFQFLVCFCQALAIKIHKPVPSYADAMELISSRISYPSDIRDFFDHNFKRLMDFAKKGKFGIRLRIHAVLQKMKIFWKNVTYRLGR